MQKLKVYQSIWAMQQRSGALLTEREPVLDRIAEAGYSGVALDVSVDEINDGLLYKSLLKERNLECQVIIFPRDDGDFVKLLEFTKEMNAQLCVVVGMAFPLNVSGAIPIVRNWMSLAEKVGMPILFETHRNCILNDMFYTLELLDAVPEMNLCADFSHYVLNRELRLPAGNMFEHLFNRLIERSSSFQGRISSHEQIQIQLDFPQHTAWVEFYKNLWRRGIESWRQRMSDSDALVFLCELGPPPYAITNVHGEELSDRWAEAQTIKSWIESIWMESEPECNSSHRHAS